MQSLEEGAAWPDSKDTKFGHDNFATDIETTSKQSENDFSSVIFKGTKDQIKGVRVPRRVIHFSDGVVEEYSSDEDDLTQNNETITTVVDPKTLKWMPYLWYYTTTCAAKALAAADFCGEKLAWFFGITSPKYQYELDEYIKMQKEEEEEAQREARELEAMEARRAARKIESSLDL